MSDTQETQSLGNTGEWLALASSGTDAAEGDTAASKAAAQVDSASVGATQVTPRVPESSVPIIEPLNAPEPIVPGAAIEPSHFAPSKPKKAKVLRIAVGVLFGLLALGYIGGVIAFFNICYPNTSITGVDVSLMTRSTAAQRVQSGATNYRLVVTGDGFEWTFDPESSSEVIDGEKAVDRVIAANEPFIWPYRLYQAHMGKENPAQAESTAVEDVDIESLELPDAFDREAFSSKLRSTVDAFNKDRTGTFDAAGTFDEKTGTFSMEKARANQKLDADQIEKTALNAIAQLKTKVEINEKSYIPLSDGHTNKDIEAALNKANELIGMSIELTMGGTTVATLDGKTMAAWVTFDDKLTPSLDAREIAPWVKSLAKSTLDTVGTERAYTRADGKKIKVGGGTFGWNSNEKELVKLIQTAVDKKESGKIEIPFKQKGDTFTKFGARDWGGYIDIDLSEQYARYYDENDKIVWESGVITGNPGKDYTTPTGIYMINSNDGGASLRGADYDKDGKPDYITPVAYWMPFIGGAVGLHDADWQSSSNFGKPGVEYSVGSHGCVNLPPAKAKELHELIKPGLCVISHY